MESQQRDHPQRGKLWDVISAVSFITTLFFKMGLVITVLSLSQTHSMSHSLTLSLSLSFSHTLTHSLSLSLCLSLHHGIAFSYLSPLLHLLYLPLSIPPLSLPPPLLSSPRLQVIYSQGLSHLQTERE